MVDASSTDQAVNLMIHGQSDVVITGPVGDLNRGSIHGVELACWDSGIERLVNSLV